MAPISKILLLSTPILLSACVPLIIAGGAESAVVVSQERTVGRAVDDGKIYVEIKARYAAQDKTGDVFANVIIKVVEGRVLLTGNVDKPESQVMAVDLAWKVNGVKEVINEIQVNDKSGFSNYAMDVWVSTQVRTKLLLTKGIRSVNYSVITVNQVVYLMGVAQDQAELDAALAVANNVDHVKKVVSYVRLKDDPARQ